MSGGKSQASNRARPVVLIALEPGDCGEFIVLGSRRRIRIVPRMCGTIPFGGHRSLRASGSDHGASPVARRKDSAAREHPLGVAPVARPSSRRPPSSVVWPKSSVRMWQAEPALARSKWARRPGSPVGKRGEGGGVEGAGADPGREAVHAGGEEWCAARDAVVRLREEFGHAVFVHDEVHSGDAQGAFGAVGRAWPGRPRPRDP